MGARARAFWAWRNHGCLRRRRHCEVQAPTTAMQAYDVFHFAAMLLQLMGGIRFEPPTNERPRIASLAVVAKDVPLHSHLDGADKIPSAAKLQKLEEMLHFVKKAEWIQSPRWSPRNEAWERKFDDSLTPLDFRKTYAEAQKAAEMASMYFGKQLHFPPIVGEDVPMPDATCSSKNPFESIFGPTPPRIIPHDAQTVPPPPHFPEPPECMFYGWVLEPELFGPGRHHTQLRWRHYEAQTPDHRHARLRCFRVRRGRDRART
ncbi:hypothetical protein DFH06DRAFT_484576 [Mycena polygramma]|nr:hypothetical protein DFH06DRAFT_484576 [Mycena polygramma]